MSNLGQKARSAVIWNAGFSLFCDLLQFGTMLVLVRLLAPASYGEFGLVMSIIGFLSIFSFNNFVAHALQAREDADTRWQEHFTAGAVLQGGMFVLTNLVALALRWFPAYAAVAPLVHVMSLTYLLEWPWLIRCLMLERALDFRRLRLLNATGLLAAAATSLLLASLGFGTMALVAPTLLTGIPFLYDLFVRCRWRPNWSWSWEAYRPAWQFGLTRIGSGLAFHSRQILESTTAIALIGFGGFGIFTRSVGLSTMFCQKIAFQLLNSIYPLLTRLEGQGGNPARIGGLVLRLVVWIVVPIAIVFAALAAPVVRVVYGAKWMEVTPLLPWAMAWGALAAVAHAAYMLLLARQKARLCLVADVGMLAGTGVALALALPHGILAYLMAIVGVQMMLVVALLVTLARCAAVSVVGLRDAFFPAVLAGAVAWCALAVAQWLAGWGAPTVFLTALIWGSAFGLLYLAILRVGFKQELVDLIAYFPARRPISRLLALPAAS
jgi:O-antigen/teichoic acid export membrane protein